MANKALATRQKMRLLAKPGPPLGKSRNPFAGLAKQRAAGPHGRSEGGARQAARQALKKTPTTAGDDD